VKVAGNWAYLYRAVDSAGETIEFMLSPKRDLIAAKLYLRLAFSTGGSLPRVINVDGHPAYASAITGTQRVRRTRTALPLPNITLLSSSRTIDSSRSGSSLGFRSAEGACRTIEGYEAMHAIRKGQIRWVGKGDPVGQRQFVHTIFGVAA